MFRPANFAAAGGETLNPTAASTHQTGAGLSAGNGDFPMRIFMIFAVAAIVVAIGYGAGHAYFARSRPVASTAAVSNTLSPHEIHLNYKAMKTLPVHDVKDAF
jgi:hypothetical protein